MILTQDEIKELIQKETPTEIQMCKVIQNYLYLKTKDKIYIKNPISYTSNKLMRTAYTKAVNYFTIKYKIK